MANARAAVGYVAANEATNSSGIEYTRGGARMAVEDRRRAMWLNAQKDTWRKDSEEQRRLMRRGKR